MAEPASLIERLYGLATDGAPDPRAPYRVPSLAEAQEESPEFLMGLYLMKRHLNLLEGRGGVGKSTLILAIALAGSQGRDLFGCEIEPFKTLVFGKQDSPGEILKKARELGIGDPSKIAVDDSIFRLDDKGFDTVRAKIEVSGASYIAFDPMKSYFPKEVDKEYNNLEQERFFDKLRRLARDLGVAIQPLRHFATAMAGKTLEDLGAGGQEWRNSARRQLVCLRHPKCRQDEMRMGVFPVKGSSLALPGAPFEISIIGGIFAATKPDEFEDKLLMEYAEGYPQVASYYSIKVEGGNEETRGRKADKLQEAIRIIIDLCAEESKPYAEVIKAVTGSGISERTFHAAKSCMVKDGTLSYNAQTKTLTYLEPGFDPFADGEEDHVYRGSKD